MSLPPPLAQLRKNSPEIVVAAVIDADGQVQAISTADDREDDIIGPIASTLGSVAERAASELGRGHSQTMVLTADNGVVVLRALNRGSVLAAVAEPGARLGLLMHDLEACAGVLTRDGEVARA